MFGMKKKREVSMHAHTHAQLNTQTQYTQDLCLGTFGKCLGTCWDVLSKAFGRVLFRKVFGDVSGNAWGHSGTSLGMSWDLFGDVLGRVWQLVGACLGTCCRVFGEVLKHVWGRFETCLGTFWDVLGVDFKSVWGRFRMCLKQLCVSLSFF